MKLLQVERRGWAQLGGKSGLGDDDVSATHNFSLSLSLSLSLSPCPSLSGDIDTQTAAIDADVVLHQ